MTRPVTTWQRFLKGRQAVWLTHGSLLLMMGLYAIILIRLPFWWALLPGMLLAHRIGILLHEYLHGIPFRYYRHNAAVYTLCDGLMLLFGMFELFRGSHLTHHRYLNTPQESPLHGIAPEKSRAGLWGYILELEAVRHIIYLAHALRGKLPCVQPRRILIALLLSCGIVVACILTSRSDIVAKMMAVNVLTVLVPIALRAAVEHHSHAGDPHFANEYRVWITLFNLNRHIHHHEDPRCPWYLLKWRTPEPLPAICYFTHWYRLHIRHDFERMNPPEREVALRPPIEV